ncbi:MAG: hypothetical protein Q8R97_06365, partial [Brevundimonas sp.]|nr:hypothetical protein [Brevundimonas sp.]
PVRQSGAGRLSISDAETDLQTSGRPGLCRGSIVTPDGASASRAIRPNEINLSQKAENSKYPQA